MDKMEYENILDKIGGSTIAVVYVFEGDNTSGFQHYDPWKSDVISDWLKAIQELHCMPFILDVRTFCQKALANTLPCIDYVINLNAGTRNLSTLGLIPSICSFLDIPCIPSDTVTTVVGENKRLSNLLSAAMGSNIPKEIPISDPNGIFRPLNLGSSHGVKKGFSNVNSYEDYLYQEFIQGFDMTIPILYNPLTEQLECIPAIMYYPDKADVCWFLGEKEKEEHAGYSKVPVKIEKKAQEHFLNLAKRFGITAYARIDTRVFCQSLEELETSLIEEIKLDRINFIEINPLPTIKNDINFHTSFQSIDLNSSLGECIRLYNKHFNIQSFAGFLLSSSIISILKARH